MNKGLRVNLKILYVVKGFTTQLHWGGELSIAKNSGVGDILTEVCNKNVNANSGNASYPSTHL